MHGFLQAIIAVFLLIVIWVAYYLGVQNKRRGAEQMCAGGCGLQGLMNGASGKETMCGSCQNPGLMAKNNCAYCMPTNMQYFTGRLPYNAENGLAYVASRTWLPIQPKIA